MIKRSIQVTIEKSLNEYPVVGMLGSRQVGKTTLARTIQQNYRRKSIYIDLELPSDLNKLQEPEIYLSQYMDTLVIIDEVQRMPALFPLMRALIDRNRVSGRFLILGSASPDLIKQSSESLAGRIIYHELLPFTLQESGVGDISQLWLRGGYPDSYLSEDDGTSFTWREAFIKTYLEMDIPQLGIHVPALQLRRFWTMIAHSQGKLWNASQLAGSLGISAPTVRKYMDILSETFITRQLQPYHFNIKKRLIKSPKVYIRDSGLLHALLKIRTMNDLQEHPTLGSSWEGFIIEQIIGSLPADWETYFYRTSAGAEIDLLIINDRSERIAVEVKFSLSPKVTKGFWVAMQDLSCQKGFVVYPGEEKYPIGENVFALPVRDIMAIAE